MEALSTKLPELAESLPPDTSYSASNGLKRMVWPTRAVPDGTWTLVWVFLPGGNVRQRAGARPIQTTVGTDSNILVYPVRG